MAFTMPQNIESRPVTVIGGGTLGRKIALMMADRGGVVRVVDKIPEVREAAKAYVEENLPALAATIDGGAVGRIELSDDMAAAVKGAWLVVECIPEKLELKTAIFGELDQLADDDAILASNSSSYASEEMIGLVKRQERVCNVHFYQPPEMPAADLMSCGHTDPAILPFLKEELAKHGVYGFIAATKSTGFIFNRIWAAIKRECLAVVADGVSNAADIDQMWMLNFGMTWGPFELMDKVGLDVVRDIELHYLHERPGLPTNTIELLDGYIARGELGRKTGKGFYDYPAQ
ncbi:MAG: 3-hydroxyacyl-CoA dehydrogenase family protein [Austwickia sp.]|nr:3-hydroxyacyl-CoA dehydrogenase family protein [Austwickia sp.]MCO5309067.1 3-hydroxyacyl-CoA dehydrogenase family protein [Austwickia sp.]